MKKYIFFVILINSLLTVYSQSRQSGLLTDDEYRDLTVELMFEHNYCTIEVSRNDDPNLINGSAYYSGSSDLPVVAMKKNNYVMLYLFTNHKPDINEIIEVKGVIEARTFNTNKETDIYAMLSYFNYLNNLYFY